MTVDKYYVTSHSSLYTRDKNIYLLICVRYTVGLTECRTIGL